MIVYLLLCLLMSSTLKATFRKKITNTQSSPNALETISILLLNLLNTHFSKTLTESSDLYMQ